ncbi:MAG: Crp/Fnr family transcriptional regulator [Betaproteobacteria bacterium]
MLENGEIIDLAFEEILCEAGDRVDHVYFPINGFISMVAPLDGDVALEVGLVGDEGMVGIALVLGVEVSPLRALVQGAGRALRVDAAAFRRVLAESPTLQQALHRYTYVLMSQLAQTAACTRFHLVEERLARWLLMTQDRAHADVFHITHQFLGYMLGVRRVGITKAATALQNRELIHYTRGDITVLDRVGLKQAACECYLADRNVYEKYLG